MSWLDWLMQSEWRFLLALLGIAVAMIAIFFGFMDGELKRVREDPEVQANIARDKAERDRQQAWKDNFK